MDRNTLRDQVIWAVWANNGGSPFKPHQAWECWLPRQLQDQIIALRTYSHRDPFRSAMRLIGGLLADAADCAYLSAHGLSVVRQRAGVYRVVRRGAVERVELADRAAVLEAVARAEARIGKALADLQAARVEIAALADAIGRGASEGNPDDDAAELLSAIARAHGDAWVSARQLGPVVGRSKAEKAKLEALIGRVIDGKELEVTRDTRTGWRLYRVMLA